MPLPISSRRLSSSIVPWYAVSLLADIALDCDGDRETGRRFVFWHNDNAIFLTDLGLS